MSEVKSKRLRIHLLIRDDAGPIQSSRAPGSLPVGTSSRWRVACDASIVQGELDRGTTEPWGVRCDECRATGAFVAINRPKPGQRLNDEQMMADGSGCCD